MKAKTIAQWHGFIAVSAFGLFVMTVLSKNPSFVYLMVTTLLMSAAAIMRTIGAMIDAIREPSEELSTPPESR